MGKIHLNGTMFLCRNCYNLAYESQRTIDVIRSLRKAKIMRQRMGGSLSIFEPIPLRPKGMHRNSYLRKCKDIEMAELKMWEEFAKLVHF